MWKTASGPDSAAETGVVQKLYNNGIRGLPVSGQKRTRIRAEPCTERMPAWTCERFARFCRARFPSATEQHLAMLTGQPAGTCRKHLTGETRPGADAMLAYVAVFGPEFLAAMLPACDWLARAADDETRREIRSHLERIGGRV